MTAERVAIVGCGVVSNLGLGLGPTAAALDAGRSGLGVRSHADVEGLQSTLAGEIRDFDPHAYLEGKPLRGMSRSAHLACTAAALALADRRPGESATPPDRVGLVAGTAYGNVQSMVRFDQETFREGPRFVDATLFPNTVINSPAGFVSIFFGLAGPNSTLAEGVSSSLAALDYASTLLARGLADEVLSGGFEELSPWVYLGLHNAGRLAGSKPGTLENASPFGRARTGVVFGEGAAFLRLRRATDSPPSARGFLAGCGEAYASIGWADARPSVDARSDAMRRAMQGALHAAGLDPGDIGAVWASAAGDPERDAAEARALLQVFGRRLPELPVVAVKAALGECFGASGALQVSSALAALEAGRVPPTAAASDTEWPALRGLQPRAQPLLFPRILVNAFNGDGNNRSLVIAAE